jgi:hypothetical protein
MVQAPNAKVEPEPVASATVPAAFAELLKDWPTLGEPTAPAEPVRTMERNTERHAERDTERIALRAEALVMQRLPALMAGLVSQAVRDAMAEVDAAEREP